MTPLQQVTNRIWRYCQQCIISSEVFTFTPFISTTTSPDNMPALKQSMLELDRPSSLLPLCTELTIPEVIVLRKAKGLPMATTNSPCRTSDDRPTQRHAAQTQTHRHCPEQTRPAAVVPTAPPVPGRTSPVQARVPLCCPVVTYNNRRHPTGCPLRKRVKSSSLTTIVCPQS
ncbi:hypothetical protein INR49_030766 [Caranx melampygus]|nr:hypothetical protein INR49_030766 [Caranx melampygus]